MLRMHAGRVPGLCALIAFIGALAASSAAAQTLRPIVHIESDPDGTRYVRVMERRHAADAEEMIQNLASSPRINIRSARPTLVRNVTVRNAEYGVNVRGRAPVSIENLNVIDWNGGGEIYGAAIKINRSAGVATYIQRVFADGMEAPDSSYRRSNTDFIGVERNSGPVYVRYATGRRWGDAGVDAKSDIALMNVTIDGAHRGLRVWSGVTMTIANSIINVPRGHQQVWLQQPTSRLRYYNVLWCVGSADPSPDDPACSNAPTRIGADGVNRDEARRQISALDNNPLTSNPFFASRIDRVVVQVSRDHGARWTTMAASGRAGGAPIGDMRYRIPFNLRGGDYRFRVFFERNGSRVGSITTINEDGRAVSGNS